MNKGPIISIVVIVVLAAFLYFVFFARQGAIPPSIIHTTSVIGLPNTTTTTTVNANRTLPNVTYHGCLSSGAVVPINNGDFGTGTFAGWNVTGVGFSSAPLNITYANKNFYYYNSSWANYNGTFFATTYRGLSISPGNLTSAPFIATEPYLNFKIVSPQSDLLYVEILNGGRPVIVSHYNTYNPSLGLYSSTFANASIPLITVLCKNISIRVVAGVVGGKTNLYSIMAVGDFYLSKNPLESPGILINQTFS